MTFEDLKSLYEEKRNQYGEETPKYISQILKEAKDRHRAWFLSRRPAGDHEQSWRAFKGKNLEKLILHIIGREVGELGLKIVRGDTIERCTHLPVDLCKVKRNVLVDFGRFGMHLPDVDLVIYEPTTCKVLAVISSKVTLRERIAQTAYWKIKLAQSPITKHINVYFMTLDEDGTLTSTAPVKKGRAIVEKELDGTYVLSETPFEASEKVRSFGQFIEDLRRLKDSILQEPENGVP